MANKATTERVHSDAELNQLVYGDEKVPAAYAVPAAALRRIRSAAHSVISRASKLGEIPPARWVIGFVKSACSRALSMLKTYGRSKRNLVALAAAALLTPTGRKVLDKGVRFFGRSLFWLARGITKPLAWTMRKLHVRSAANTVEFSPMMARTAVSNAYKRACDWLSATLPLDHKAVRFIGQLGFAWSAGAVMGSVLHHVLPLAWRERAVTWLRGLLVGTIALAGATPFLRGRVEMLDRFTRKVETVAERLTEPTRPVLEPQMVTRNEALNMVIERTIAAMESDRKYPSSEALAQDLARVISAPLAAVLPQQAVIDTVAGYTNAICPWDFVGTREQGRAELMRILEREITDACKNIPADTPAMTLGYVSEDPDPTVLQKVVDDLQDAQEKGELVSVGAAKPVPTPPAKRTPPARKRQHARGRR